jgi:Smg protein
VVDIFFYLFENFTGINQCPDAPTLARRMASDGFEEHEVRAAVSWIEQLRQPLPITQYRRMQPISFRIYHASERIQISDAGLNLLSQLEHAGSIDAITRERIVERCMLLPYPIASEEAFKALLLTILWAENLEIDELLLHSLLDQTDDVRH